MQRVLFVALFFCCFTVFAGETVLKLYRPFGDTIDQVAPTVFTTVHGQCYSQSELVVREDAWRCQADGKWYDPCFVKISGKSSEVICPESPWVGKSVRILVDGALNNENNVSLDMSTAYPWAVELMDGEKCQAINSQEAYEGLFVRYRCSNDAFLVGELHRCKTEWSILEKSSKGIETVQLSRVWF